MKCRYCGYEIPEGLLYCDQCGKELCIVPEYNPLDDMLTAQIKVAINEHSAGTDDENNYDNRRTSNTGRNTGRNTSRNTNRNTGRNTNRNTSRNTGRNTTGNLSDRDQRRRKMERKKAQKRKLRNRILLVLGIIIAVAVAAGVILYQNSYTGIVNKGYKAEQKKEYEQAEIYFKKAVKKNQKKADAYTGLAKVYIAQNDLDKAENVFLSAIAGQPKNTDLYEAGVQFYLDTDQQQEIPSLLEDANDSVRDALSGYIIDGPTYSLDEKEKYDDVMQLELTSKESAIYYTTDGKAPTTKSTKYAEPIQLEEGENVITAIAVNKKGVPSLPVKKTYEVEFPVEDAPAVSPSTGQYESDTKIEIKVPEGYTAYYTLDKSDPTSASTKYDGPIDMPDGETIFKAVLVNAKGKESGITTRNYLLEK